MQRIALGDSGIQISPMFIGGMSFGKPDPEQHVWTIDQEGTEAVIGRALELGVNAIDTANCYARGTSEEFIGRALKNLGVARDQVVLASKVYFNEGHSSAKAIKREIEGTLKRLQTDYLDLYILHRFDYDTPMEETMQALDKLVREGKVRAIGASEMYGYQYHNLQDIAERNGWTKLSTVQCHYNLIYREDERELIPVARQFNAIPTPYSPLASGHLARKTWDSDSVRSKTDKVEHSKYDRNKSNDMPIVERVAKLAQKHGVSMPQIALAWHWTHGPSAPIVGCSSPKRVDQAVAALDVKLSPEDVAYLEEPYVAHELVGPLARPGERVLAGTTVSPETK
ncbi:aryl-alcohol dehydrogenase-like predicted oxidoreductase [Bifidobacterium commune]|uniref:Predicted oxidoreductase n=1 Tax=Bifidobacterium commune TaxID=1505727 RepID=A0A1C4H7R8_9BIFI|nr:aldo/keto reductase [Bifidobacterium commune]MBB2955468.1 aryl-alcohol dehydrogenase-like predicted oxidoreductase [Bifidobacterium commune]MBB2955600.1 aryl-alcohol dehydrogenase-like predicted oxidoreductase [Bifidobacterium commune]SCC80740.1 Predicted oxidoreductase [Bifidobacterium commune]